MIARVIRTTEDFRKGDWIVVLKDYGHEVLAQTDDGTIGIIDKHDVEEVGNGKSTER